MKVFREEDFLLQNAIMLHTCVKSFPFTMPCSTQAIFLLSNTNTSC